MSNTRKTIDRTLLVNRLNMALAADAGLTAAQRLTLAEFVGSVLIDGSSYCGYTYLASEYAAEGEATAPGAPRLRLGFDESRRRYF